MKLITACCPCCYLTCLASSERAPVPVGAGLVFTSLHVLQTGFFHTREEHGWIIPAGLITNASERCSRAPREDNKAFYLWVFSFTDSALICLAHNWYWLLPCRRSDESMNPLTEASLGETTASEYCPLTDQNQGLKWVRRSEAVESGDVVSMFPSVITELSLFIQDTSLFDSNLSSFPLVLLWFIVAPEVSWFKDAF